MIGTIVIGTPPRYRVAYDPDDGDKVVSINGVYGKPGKSQISLFVWPPAAGAPNVRVEVGQPLPQACRAGTCGH